MCNNRTKLMAGLLSGLMVLSPCLGARPGTLSAASQGTPAAQVTPLPPPQEAITLQEAFVKIADEVKPAVVNISTIYVEKSNAPQYEFFFGSPFEDFFDDFFGESRPRNRQQQQQQQQQRGRPQQRRYEGTGSGVIIDAEGYILTNEHVVRGAKEIKVTTADNKKFTGKVIGTDARTDLAVIKIKAGKDIPYVRLGDSAKIRVGEWAVAIGSPFGLEETVTAGIISAVRQSLVIEGHDYRDLIQTDAAINRGNSGGPLCNIRGEVIGINTAIYAPTGVFSGIGFAIPINSAREVLDDLIHKGKVVRGWLGVEIRPIDEAVMKQFDLPDQKGVLVNNVLAGSPAEKAGIRRGDVITEVNGKQIDDVRALQSLIAQTEPKKKLEIKVLRDRKAQTITLSAGEMPSEEEAAKMQGQGAAPEEEEGEGREPETFDWEGMKVITLDPAMAQRFDIPKDEKGCVVVSVDQGSTAEDMGAMPGDLIRAINRTPTPTLKEFKAVTGKVKLSQGVVLDVDRQGRLLYLSYTPGQQQQ